MERKEIQKGSHFFPNIVKEKENCLYFPGKRSVCLFIKGIKALQILRTNNGNGGPKGVAVVLLSDYFCFSCFPFLLDSSVSDCCSISVSYEKLIFYLF